MQPARPCPPFPAFTSQLYRTRYRARYESRFTLFLKRPPADELDRVQLADGGATRKKSKPKSVSSAAARAVKLGGEGGDVVIFLEGIKCGRS